MAAKRALIVDDSRSARVILSRMLEGYGIKVDAAESAEQALELLKQSRPDVIFMDHLMPGMDGFQAVQAIKGNPETATIPVMMYTSQEGELYVSQARALGAVGVLPKTVKPVDVSRVLYQLNLLPDRRQSSTLAGRPLSSAGDMAQAVVTQDFTSPPDLEASIAAVVTPALKEHTAQLRRFVLASFEAFARRITAEIKAAPTHAQTLPTPALTDPPAVPPKSQSTPWRWLALLGAIAVLAVLTALYLHTLRSIDELMRANARLAAVVEEQQAQLLTLQQQRIAATSPLPSTKSPSQLPAVDPELVPYGEPPLSGTRIERLRDLIEELRQQGFKGSVRLVSYIGDFCLSGNGIEGFSLADEELAARRCDLIGNPFEDGLTSAQRQSVAFANLVSNVRQELRGAINIEVSFPGRRPVVPYPDRDRERLTAGEWNRIAERNNRVEFSLVPKH